jgi:PAS domain S-box-containing protein
MQGMNISRISTLSPEESRKNLAAAAIEKCTHFTCRHRLRNGDIKTVEVYSSPIEFENKEVLYFIIHDVSEKTLAQETLEESESAMRAMINSTDSLVYLFDLKGKIITLNTPGAKLFKKTPQEMVGKNFKNFFSENDYSRISTLVKKVVETHKPVHYQAGREKRFYDVTLYPVLNSSNRVDRICAFTGDITDLKKTERVFTAIETAGGICHEMNQPLQVILGNLELLKLKIGEDDPNIKLINTILSQTEKIGMITKKLTHITRYETKKYVKGTIFDIDRSSEIK